MSFSLFVAKRYLLARRKQTFISIIGIFSMLGVALGVGALIVTQKTKVEREKEIKETVNDVLQKIREFLESN